MGGPHGATRPADVHDASNLMLLCPGCHKLVADRPDEYTVEVLRKHKKAHEDRGYMLTDTKPDRHSVAVALTARIGWEAGVDRRQGLGAAVAGVQNPSRP